MEAQQLVKSRGRQLRSRQEGDVSQTARRCLQSQRRQPTSPALEARGQPGACLNIIDVAREHRASGSWGGEAGGVCVEQGMGNARINKILL